MSGWTVGGRSHSTWRCGLAGDPSVCLVQKRRCFGAAARGAAAPLPALACSYGTPH